MNTSKTTPSNPGSHPMFIFEGKSLRVVLINNTPWFIALDVCRALDIYIRIRDGRAELHDNYKRNLEADEVSPTNCGGKSLASISESALYKLIMRAQPRVNPTVHRFQNWVTREVLPALRKDGMYVVGEEKVKTGEMSEDELVLKAMTLLQKKTERLAVECAAHPALASGLLKLLFE